MPCSEHAPQTRRRTGLESVLLPIGCVATFGFGVVLLDKLVPPGWSTWLQLIAGVMLCMFAGWVACATWSKSYWNRSMVRQVATWRCIVDAFFAWIDETAVSTEALQRLKVSLEEALPTEPA